MNLYNFESVCFFHRAGKTVLRDVRKLIEETRRGKTSFRSRLYNDVMYFFNDAPNIHGMSEGMRRKYAACARGLLGKALLPLYFHMKRFSCSAVQLLCCCVGWFVGWFVGCGGGGAAGFVLLLARLPVS